MSIQNKNLDFTGFTKGIIEVLENVGSSKKKEDCGDVNVQFVVLKE